MSSELINAEIQKLDPSSIVELFILDATALGGDIFYFHAGTNGLRSNVIWQGQEYVRFPIEVNGFEISGQGSLPRPKLRVSNALGAISVLLLNYNDLIGSTFTRKRTHAKFLDAINFSGGNADADPSAEYPDDIFIVDRKSSENYQAVEFELASIMDLAGVQLPRRQVIQNLCPWKYRGGECGYTGTDYFTADDVSTSDSSLDVCGKRVSSCKKRFGETSELPFGGFPGAGLTRT